MSDYDEISHLISLHAQQQMRGFLPLGIGHVTAYDPNANAVQVVFPGMPVVDPLSGAPTGEYSISPWVQLGSIWVGNGWGFQTAPEVGAPTPPFGGTQCAVYIQQRYGHFGLAGHLLFTQAALPPDNTLVAGEAIFKHKSGTLIKFHSNGQLEIVALATEMTTDVAVSGSVFVGTGASGTFTTPTGQTVTVQDGIITNIY